MGKLKRAYSIYRREGWLALADEIRRYLILHQIQPRITNHRLHARLGDFQIRPPDRLSDYWRNPNDDIDDVEHQLRLDRSPFLFEVLESHIDPTDPILEVGSGVGRNLNYLYEKGYTDLTGIDINERAFEVLKREFPELARRGTLYNEPIEDVITELPTNAFEVTYTLSALLAIHPDHEFVFDEMVRITRGHIVTVENEETYTHKQVARDYAEVFTDRGCELVRTIGGTEIADRSDIPSAYRARVFDVR